MEDSQTDNNSSCSEGGEKTGQAKIGGFVCIGKALLGRHPWRLSSPVSSWLEPAGIACVWRRAVPASLHKDSVQFPLGITPVLSTVRFLCAQPVSVPVDGSTSIWCISLQLSPGCKGAAGALCPLAPVLNEDPSIDFLH